EEQVEEISPNTLEAAKTLSKVASLKSRSIDKGRRYKRRKETKGKKVVSSLDFQEGTDAGAEQVNTPSAEQVNTPSAEQVNTASAEQVNTASGVNTGSIKHSTGDEQLSTEEVDAGAEQGNIASAEQVNIASAEQVNTASAEQVSTAEGVNTGSIKLSTGDEQLSASAEQVSTVGAKESTSDQDKGQREGKAPMISE
ncbi:hypothetical protein Tco_0188455, partial [Tanacetum coccineum]